MIIPLPPPLHLPFSWDKPTRFNSPPPSRLAIKVVGLSRPGVLQAVLQRRALPDRPTAKSWCLDMGATVVEFLSLFFFLPFSLVPRASVMFGTFCWSADNADRQCQRQVATDRGRTPCGCCNLAAQQRRPLLSMYG
jgi:hypothetical protein